MRKFLYKLISYCFIVLFIMIILMILPGTPREKGSLIYAKLDKNALLKSITDPRLIFIGDSNLSMGLDGQAIRDSLGYYPIDLSINAGLGLKYILECNIDDLKENDIVILSSVYENFFGDYAYGEEILLRMICDVVPEDIILLNHNQLNNILPFTPKFAFSKAKPNEYINVEKNQHNAYLRKSYDQYGINRSHWNLSSKKVEPIEKKDIELNLNAFKYLSEFKERLKGKNIQLYITYPCMQEQSYINTKEQNKTVEDILIKNGYNIISEPENYLVPDSLLYDTPYHLTKKGIDVRTTKLIRDIRNNIPQFKQDNL